MEGLIREPSTVYVKYYKLSDRQVMHTFHHFVSGNASSCFMTHFTPSLPTIKGTVTQRSLQSPSEGAFPP